LLAFFFFQFDFLVLRVNWVETVFSWSQAGAPGDGFFAASSGSIPIFFCLRKCRLVVIIVNTVRVYDVLVGLFFGGELEQGAGRRLALKVIGHLLLDFFFDFRRFFGNFGGKFDSDLENLLFLVSFHPGMLLRMT